MLVDIAPTPCAGQFFRRAGHGGGAGRPEPPAVEPRRAAALLPCKAVLSCVEAVRKRPTQPDSMRWAVLSPRWTWLVLTRAQSIAAATCTTGVLI